MVSAPRTITGVNLNFARILRLRITDSWYRRPVLHRYIAMPREVLVLGKGSYRTVSRSAEFFVTDNMLVVASLKLHVKSKKPSRCDHTVLHRENLKDLTCAQEYAMAVFNRFGLSILFKTR